MFSVKEKVLLGLSSKLKPVGGKEKVLVGTNWTILIPILTYIIAALDHLWEALLMHKGIKSQT